jgi:hypothetical protein
MNDYDCENFHSQEIELRAYALISLPNDIADELIDDNLAAQLATTRGPAMADIFSITVDCINTGAAVVSVAVGAAACRRLAVAAIKGHRPPDPNIVTFEVTKGLSSKKLTVDVTLPTAEDEVFDFFVAALSASN